MSEICFLDKTIKFVFLDLSLEAGRICHFSYMCEKSKIIRCISAQPYIVSLEFLVLSHNSFNYVNRHQYIVTIRFLSYLDKSKIFFIIQMCPGIELSCILIILNLSKHPLFCLLFFCYFMSIKINIKGKIFSQALHLMEVKSLINIS